MSYALNSYTSPLMKICINGKVFRPPATCVKKETGLSLPLLSLYA